MNDEYYEEEVHKSHEVHEMQQSTHWTGVKHAKKHSKQLSNVNEMLYGSSMTH